MKGEQLAEVKDCRGMYNEAYDWLKAFAERLLADEARTMKANHKKMRLMFKIIKKQQRENNELREKLMKAQG